MKLLIAYATRYGSTTKTAALLAESLQKAGLGSVTVTETRSLGRGALEEYDAFIVGSSIAAGRWKGSAKRFLAKAAAAGKPVAVFVSAGGVMSGKGPGDKPDAPPQGTLEEREAKAIGLYIEPLIRKLGLEPIATAAFGGRMRMFGKEMFDTWQAEPIAAWGEKLAKLFG